MVIFTSSLKNWIFFVKSTSRRLARLGKRGERRLASVNPEDLTDGEETKARLSLFRPEISDPSHPTGELWWSTRAKKNMGRSSDAAVGLAKGSEKRGGKKGSRWDRREGKADRDSVSVVIDEQKGRGTTFLWLLQVVDGGLLGKPPLFFILVFFFFDWSMDELVYPRTRTVPVFLIGISAKGKSYESV
ncbi:unnamed protein product [Lactuca saligna]|uniref:Uncharacterized protein n=1 Tax=Lactuca saligna TaxID=75948 RepID=A0AA35ZIJ4_LACSI|nr:unnamed protein product [Lactuca saligna]